MYIGLVVDIGPIGANGNLGTIGPNKTKITNRTSESS